jgi:hypothetical protein
VTQSPYPKSHHYEKNDYPKINFPGYKGTLISHDSNSQMLRKKDRYYFDKD